MATQNICKLTYPEGTIELEMEFDAADDSLTKFKVLNASSRVAFLLMTRSNGARWQNRRLQPGVEMEFPAQGPVSHVEDVTFSLGA